LALFVDDSSFDLLLCTQDVWPGCRTWWHSYSIRDSRTSVSQQNQGFHQFFLFI